MNKRPHAWTPGSTWSIQYLYRDLGGPSGLGMNASNALKVTFNP